MSKLCLVNIRPYSKHMASFMSGGRKDFLIGNTECGNI